MTTDELAARRARKKPEGDKTPAISVPGMIEKLSAAPWIGVIGFNERTTDLMLLREPPCRTAHDRFPAVFEDADFTSIVQWFEGAGFKAPANQNVLYAVVRVATLNRFDPVRDYLDGLAWDGIERVTTFVDSYFGGGDDPSADAGELEAQGVWRAEIGKRWLISAVARTYDPGCQVDTVLIAEGVQGAKKSSGFRALAGPDDWFATDVPDIGSKDAVHHVLGPWLVEFDELDVMRKREASTIKSFITRRSDRARLSYGKLARNYPRRVAFCGTTNEGQYNQDTTGGRRFWGFAVRGRVDVEAIARDRDQLWAEAVHLYRAGHAWHIDDDDDSKLHATAISEQRKRVALPPCFDRVAEYFHAHPEGVEVATILSDVLEVEPVRAHLAQKDVIKCLQHLGAECRQVRRGNRRPRVYTPIPDHRRDES